MGQMLKQWLSPAARAQCLGIGQDSHCGDMCAYVRRWRLLCEAREVGSLWLNNSLPCAFFSVLKTLIRGTGWSNTVLAHRPSHTMCPHLIIRSRVLRTSIGWGTWRIVSRLMKFLVTQGFSRKCLVSITEACERQVSIFSSCFNNLLLCNKPPHNSGVSNNNYFICESRIW